MPQVDPSESHPPIDSLTEAINRLVAAAEKQTEAVNRLVEEARKVDFGLNDPSSQPKKKGGADGQKKRRSIKRKRPIPPQEPSVFDTDGIVMRPPLAPTFELPTRDELLAVRCGDFVKLIFDGEYGERMWVRVIEQCSPSEWYGILDNDPIVIKTVQYGARIRFHPLDIIHILDISFSGEAECGIGADG